LKGFKSRLELWREDSRKLITNMLGRVSEREAMKGFMVNQQTGQA
jgi:hypothetical protein